MMIEGRCPTCWAPWLKNNRPDFEGSTNICPNCGQTGWPTLAATSQEMREIVEAVERREGPKVKP